LGPSLKSFLEGKKCFNTSLKNSENQAEIRIKIHFP